MYMDLYWSFLKSPQPPPQKKNKTLQKYKIISDKACRKVQQMIQTFERSLALNKLIAK